MMDKYENDLLIGSLATRVGLVGEHDLADSIRLAADGDEELGTLIRRKTKLDDDTWDSLTKLAKKHRCQSGGSIADSIGTLYRQTGGPSDLVSDAIKAGVNEEVWKKLVPSDEGEDEFTTIVQPDRGGHHDPVVVHRGNRFQKVRKHAAGGLGQLFVAIDDELNRQVALKQIREPYASDPDARQRFVLEAEITGGLEHPGVVPVYGLGIYKNGQPYYAMRFIRGQSMQATIEALHQKCEVGHGRWNQSPELVFELRKLLSRVVDVCQTIGYAHSRGVLHRDIKPENIMLGDYGETLVVDWGLAKVAGSEHPRRYPCKTWRDSEGNRVSRDRDQRARRARRLSRENQTTPCSNRRSQSHD